MTGAIFYVIEVLVDLTGMNVSKRWHVLRHVHAAVVASPLKDILEQVAMNSTKMLRIEAMWNASGLAR